MDFDTAILKNEERITFALRSLYARFGYVQYKMSKFEEYELYMNNKDFLISSDIISFTDTNGRLMALKPDVTLSIVRASRPGPGLVQKVYYDENVYRISKSSRSFREIRQVGLECIGDVDDYCIGEVLTLACESLRMIWPEHRLNLSHLGIVGAILDDLGLRGEARKQAVKFIGEKNLHELAALCRENGAQDEALQRLEKLVSCSGAPEAVLPALRALGCDEAAVGQLEALAALLAANGVLRSVNIDFSVLSDMSYYNGIAFKGFVAGVPAAVISGGEYDKLVSRMGKPGGAIGFACYLDQLERLDLSEAPLDVDYYARPYRLRPGLCDMPTVSADGKDFSDPIPAEISYNPALQSMNTTQLQTLVVPVKRSDIRFVKIIARPIHGIPDWHRAKGLNPWIMLDEIKIEEEIVR